MKIDLLDIDKMIVEDELKEVTNPVYFNIGSIPTEDGLFSTEIFGDIGTSERKKRFGYISLNSKFIHPVIYKLLVSIDRRIESIVHGNRYFKLDSVGNLIEDDNGETGLDFLYKNFEKIKFKPTDSDLRKTKLSLLGSLKKDEIFISRYLVIPAALRDYNPNEKSGGKIAEVDSINDIYSKIIRASSSLSGGSSFSFIANTTKGQIQVLLVEIFTRLTEDLAHKSGIIRKGLMGKSIDYATRSVISAPRVNSNSWQESQIRFGYTGIPLSQVVVQFYPFFVKYIEDFIDLHKTEFTMIKSGKDIIEIKDIDEQFSDKNINKMIDKYIKNIEGRFESIKVKDANGKYHAVPVYSKDLGRHFTVTDLLYLASVDITLDKHVYVTRYPV